MKNIFKENIEWGLTQRFYFLFNFLVVSLILFALTFGYNGFNNSGLGGGITLYFLGLFSLFYIPICFYLFRKNLISILYIFFAYELFFGFIKGHILGIFSEAIFIGVAFVLILTFLIFSLSSSPIKRVIIFKLFLLYILITIIAFIMYPIEQKINLFIYQKEQEVLYK